MFSKLSGRTAGAIRGIAICLCILMLYMSTTVVVHKDTLAQDKSTSITCNGSLPCEKTECIDGDCKTTISNSSQISTTQGSGSESNGTESDTAGESESSDTDNTIRDTIKERMSLRDD
jgi:hypothetical protein